MLMTAVTIVVSRSRGDLADERLVNLEGINGKFSQIAQAGIAGTKVVDGELNILTPASALRMDCGGFDVLHQHAFRQLQLEATRG